MSTKVSELFKLGEDEKVAITTVLEVLKLSSIRIF